MCLHSLASHLFRQPLKSPKALCTAGYGPEEESCVYELTYNYGQDKYDNFRGEGYAQVAMSTEVMLLVPHKQ